MSIAFDQDVISLSGEAISASFVDESSGATRHLQGQGQIGASGFQLIVKRAIDIAVAGLALLVLMPLLVSIAILVRLTSPGPALFTQLRWGQSGKKIRIYKFRTMYHGLGDETGVDQTREGDQRITPLGAVLRRTNLDELPQLINVLMGDMSLVGPRPHAIGMLAAGMTYEELVPEYHRRHAMRPGITGLAQMRGLRGPTVSARKARARIAADLLYIDNYSLLLDFTIILGTLRSEFLNGSGF